MNFKYKIRDGKGHVSTGFGQAESRDSLMRELRERGFSPIAIIPAAKDETGKAGGNTVASRKKKSIWNMKIGRVVKDEDLLLFTRDLLSLVHAGCPLVSGIRDVASQIKNVHFRDILENISDDINAGSKLSEALRRHPAVFSPFFVNTIQAGEQSGRLEAILGRMIQTLDNDLETKMMIKNAVRYPVIVLCFLGAAFTVIVTVVIPKISGVFTKFDTALPLPTRILIAIGNFSQSYGLFIAIALIGAVILVSFYKKTKPGRFVWDGIMLRLPVFGELIKKAALVRFATALQTLYASGIVITDALATCAVVVGNEVVGAAILQSAERMKEGLSLSEALKENQLFPPMVIGIITMGEKTGNLENMLAEIVEHYGRDIRYMTKTIGTLIEPILTVFLGLMILVLALGVFLPMWNVMKLFRH
ncbi:MAG: type II secretion system F family protein [Candidatus Omnitrophota bacterium]|nr:type II secretion system F family protein [Candidatus Omnitrophota bacterium]